MCTSRRCMCFIMCLLLQCHKCVCFATLMKLCHDLIQSAFKKMASRGHPFIQSEGWVWQNSYTVSTSAVTSLCTCLVIARGDSVKMCDEAGTLSISWLLCCLGSLILLQNIWHWADQCRAYYWVEEEVKTPSPPTTPSPQSKRFVADVYDPQKHQSMN